MVYRLSWLAGILGIGFALARAERLLRDSPSGLPWQSVLIAATLIGAAITWAGVGSRMRGHWLAVVHVVALILAVVRIAVPATTWFLFPTLDSVSAMGAELAFARDVIRTGVAPVLPLAGIVAILAVVFWMMGAVLVWGLRTGRPYLAVITPLVVYLEFAVMDRRPGGNWTTAFTVVIGLSLIAVAMDRRRHDTGRLVSSVTRRALLRTMPSIGIMSLAFTLVLSLAAANAVVDLVPRAGYLDWRAQSSLSGEYYGSVSYNPFVGIRQQLVAPTNVPVFAAAVAGDLPADDLYWRMITLDWFDGEQWSVGGRPRMILGEELDAFEDPDHAFAGPSVTVVSEVTVLALQMDWLPAPYAPTALRSTNEAVDRGYRVKIDDGALRFDALTYRGMQYVVRSDVPQPDLDVLSRRPDGTPSILFRNAIDADAFPAPGADTPDIQLRSLPDADRFLRLPDDLDRRIASLARVTVADLETDYERALALEGFFRSPGRFRYSTAIAPGHGASHLADWLLTPTSPNYRTGYCEQFATAMAVMARLVGIPSRVVLGFTPGELLADGRVVVRDRNAHAWVELWLPSQGWVRFDPTPRGDGTNPATTDEVPFDVSRYLEIPPAERPDSSGPIGGPVEPEEPTPATTVVTTPRGGDVSIATPTLPGWLLPAGLGVVLVFGLVPAIKALRRRRRMIRLSDGDVAAAWSEIVDRLTDLGEPVSARATPYEIARRTEPAMLPLADVYSEAIYGARGAVSARRIEIATESLQESTLRLLRRHSPARRLAARYRLASLLPRRRRR